MKIKIAVEFEKEIDPDDTQYASSTKDDIIRAITTTHPELKPTGEWVFLTDLDKYYDYGVIDERY